jgi:diaminopimelate epimerase
MPAAYQLNNWEGEVEGVKLEGTLVKLDGISHLLLKENEYLQDDLMEKTVKKLAEESKADALGVIKYKKRGKKYEITPCIYVPGTGSLVFERGCGSGTLALGFYKAEQEANSLQLTVVQPGGTITANVKLAASRDSITVKRVHLQTKVDITCTGKVFV